MKKAFDKEADQTSASKALDVFSQPASADAVQPNPQTSTFVAAIPNPTKGLTSRFICRGKALRMKMTGVALIVPPTRLRLLRSFSICLFCT